MRLDLSFWSRRDSRRNSHCILFEFGGGGQHSRQGVSVGARDPEGRTMEVRRVQGIYMQQYGGRESSVKKTCERRNGVCETTRPRYGLRHTATVADDLRFGGV